MTVSLPLSLLIPPHSCTFWADNLSAEFTEGKRQTGMWNTEYALTITSTQLIYINWNTYILPVYLALWMKFLNFYMWSANILYIPIYNRLHIYIYTHTHTFTCIYICMYKDFMYIMFKINQLPLHTSLLPLLNFTPATYSKSLKEMYDINLSPEPSFSL